MSIIGDLLVLIDIYKQLTLEEVCKYIPERKKQTLSSALGRLSSRGLLKKIPRQNQNLFSITRQGSDYLTNNLKVLKTTQVKKPNESWQIIVFNIPEKNRKSRDLLRRELTKLGFGRLQDSTWISTQDRSEELNYIINRLNIKNNITILFTEKLSYQKQSELSSKLYWDWKLINDNHKTFISEASVFLKNKSKSTFTARRLVYNYAQVLQYDPKLAKELLPKGDLTYKAYELYTKIRPHCYNS